MSADPSDRPAPRPASTLVLLRENPSGPPEIFMVKRSSQASFMGGAYVFPGGRLDPSDAAPDLLARVRGVTREAAERLQEPIPQAQALYVAALRETFEEAGVLVAVEADGAPIVLTSARQPKLLEARRRLIAGEVAVFTQLLQELDLYLDAAQVIFFARWVTPEAEPKRFDARFFMAITPPEQEAAHDQAETTEGAWVTADEAIALHAESKIFLAPPTFRTLENLRPFPSAQAVIDAAITQAPPVIRPFMRFSEDSELQLLLDHDPEHPSPSHGPFVAGESRIILQEGRWWSKKG